MGQESQNEKRQSHVTILSISLPKVTIKNRRVR